MIFKRFAIFIPVLFLIAACGLATPAEPTPVGPAMTEPPDYQPAVSPAPPTATPFQVDIPPAQRAAMQALSAETGVPPDQIELLSSEAVLWPDGCLGVVIPGVLCVKGPVEGFRILMAVNGAQSEYHTNQDGTNVVPLRAGLASLRVAMRAPDGSVQLIDPGVSPDPLNPPSANGFLPPGGSAGGAIYSIDFRGQAREEAPGAGGGRVLSFIQNANYTLAVWPGQAGQAALLAWGTQPVGPDLTSALIASQTDGTGLQTLLTLPHADGPPEQLVAQRWSVDGRQLVFSKEPYGIGGYIPFPGASSLYRLGLADGQAAELIPFDPQGGPMFCLDALSPDERLVADHCAGDRITVRDLAAGQATVIQPPGDAAGYRLLGSARFDSAGSRLAYALAMGDPNGEQGRVAVSDGLSGASRLVLTSQPGGYYTVVAWLNADTLLVQANPVACPSDCNNELWTVSLDGTRLNKIADGTFLALLSQP